MNYGAIIVSGYKIKKTNILNETSDCSGSSDDSVTTYNQLSNRIEDDFAFTLSGEVDDESMLKKLAKQCDLDRFE